jgi:hypothetical protein
LFFAYPRTSTIQKGGMWVLWLFGNAGVLYPMLVDSKLFFLATMYGLLGIPLSNLQSPYARQAALFPLLHCYVHNTIVALSTTLFCLIYNIIIA